MVADGSDGASSSNLHALLSAAPKRFRAVLAAGRTKRPVDELELSLLERTANEAAAGTTPCSEELSAQCEALAREAARRGGTLAIEEARRARTTAEAVCFLAGWQTWLQARDDCGAGLLHPPADDAELRRPAYLAYDVQRYNFSGLVCRIFADFLDELGDDAGPTDADRLSMLHATRAGRTEPGALADVAAWRAAGAPYSQPLDEATRFGCGSFNRAFKASPLRPAFLELYRRFVAEIIAPSLGSPSLVYQAEPVFRVFLPLHLAVGPRHVDASYHAQPNELNFWVPLTEVYGTNSLQVESAAGRADFEPVSCGVGAAYRFRGNECEHFTCLNVTGRTRVSFDFRVIREQELHLHPVASMADGAARGKEGYFRVGRYYARLGEE